MSDRLVFPDQIRSYRRICGGNFSTQFNGKALNFSFIVPSASSRQARIMLIIGISPRLHML